MGPHVNQVKKSALQGSNAKNKAASPERRRASQPTKEKAVKPARSLEEIKEAYHLVYEEYLAKGHCKPNQSKLHFHPHCVFPESRTFVLRGEGGMLLGTATIVPDSPGGLPMESSFQTEIEQLRKPGRKLGEICLLALSDEAEDGKALFQMAMEYARDVAGVTDIVTAEVLGAQSWE